MVLGEHGEKVCCFMKENLKMDVNLAMVELYMAWKIIRLVNLIMIFGESRVKVILVLGMIEKNQFNKNF